MRNRSRITVLSLMLMPFAGCASPHKTDFVLSTKNTHCKFSRTIPPVLRVPSGSIIEVHTKEATDGVLVHRFLRQPER